MARVCVVAAAIWCRITATALAAALAATPLHAAEDRGKDGNRVVKFTKKTVEKSANWVKRQTK
jgi:hypothetical protein